MAVDENVVRKTRDSLRNSASSVPSVSQVRGFSKNLSTWSGELRSEYATDIKRALDIANNFSSNSSIIARDADAVEFGLKSLSKALSGISYSFDPHFGLNKPGDL